MMIIKTTSIYYNNHNC